MKKVKICCFLESWQCGGIEAFLTSALTNMDLSGVSVDIVAARIDDSPFTERLTAIGVGFHELTGRLRAPGNTAAFRRLIRRERYDVIHFNVFQALALTYVRAAKKEGVPTRIVHAHGAGLRRSLTSPVKLLIHRLSRSLLAGCETHRLSCSESASRFFFGDGSAQRIANGIETEKFIFSPSERARVRGELGISDETLIGHVGRVSSEKNQAFLIKAFAQYARLDVAAHLLLVGDGPDLPELRQLAEELKISDKVIFYGESDRIGSLLSAMDLFVFPSLFEGFGIAAVEAQAAGLFVLCSSGVPQSVDVTESTAHLPLSAGESEWARKIAESLEISKNIDRESAHEAISRCGFDARATAERLLSLYTGEAKNE